MDISRKSILLSGWQNKVGYPIDYKDIKELETIIDYYEQQLKKKQEINKKAIEYIAICLRDSEENEDYPINKNDLDKLLQILEDKEVK